jgi:hypothetical protein
VDKVEKVKLADAFQVKYGPDDVMQAIKLCDDIDKKRELNAKNASKLRSDVSASYEEIAKHYYTERQNELVLEFEAQYGHKCSIPLLDFSLYTPQAMSLRRTEIYDLTERLNGDAHIDEQIDCIKKLRPLLTLQEHGLNVLKRHIVE